MSILGLKCLGFAVQCQSECEDCTFSLKLRLYKTLSIVDTIDNYRFRICLLILDLKRFGSKIKSIWLWIELLSVMSLDVNFSFEDAESTCRRANLRSRRLNLPALLCIDVWTQFCIEIPDHGEDIFLGTVLITCSICS